MRRLKWEYLAREKAENRRHMSLHRELLEDLFDDLDEKIGEAGCDSALRFTRLRALTNGLPEEDVIRSVRRFGGYCDCEVAPNVDPDVTN